MKLFSFTQLALAVLGSHDIRARMMQRYNPETFEDSEPLSRRGRSKPRRFRQHNQQQEQELMQALDELQEQEINDMLEFKEFMRDLDLNF
ncbi:unnamed protein product [Oikopleura dioica]|uniref:Uncharacterized protein n=1 Tax=Oikopleura dioica TaxID=34765 RepID=E4WR23_OIKDI|nr:unnamed protein product [Oikopleura dioica]CBY31141.1 unnamed protein product [Oikopleura dioica]CBY40942.1 unnamed protein product [Oikopleura dioica]